jgi:hypothetical protein
MIRWDGNNEEKPVTQKKRHETWDLERGGGHHSHLCILQLGFQHLLSSKKTFPPQTRDSEGHGLGLQLGLGLGC